MLKEEFNIYDNIKVLNKINDLLVESLKETEGNLKNIFAYLKIIIANTIKD